MQRYIMFYNSQMELDNNKWKYEANTKYKITNEDDYNYFIGDDKFSKTEIDFKVGHIISDT